MTNLEKKYLVGKKLYELYELSEGSDFSFQYEDFAYQNGIAQDDIWLLLETMKKTGVIKFTVTNGLLGISVSISPKFINWYEKVVTEYRSSTLMLTENNFYKIYDLLIDIDEQIQITQGKEVTFKVIPNIIRFSQKLFPLQESFALKDYREYRVEACKYLSKIGVLTNWNMEPFKTNGFGVMHLEVNILKFDSVIAEYKRKELEIESSVGFIEKVSDIYRMTYDGVELKVNGICLTKPQAEGENDQIASFLLNKGEVGRPYRKEELEENTKVKDGIGKNLNKVVEILQMMHQL